MDGMQINLSTIVMIIFIVILIYWIYLDYTDNVRIESYFEKKYCSDKSKSMYHKDISSSSSILFGLVLIIISLGVYFLFPLNELFDLPGDLFEKQNITLSYLFNACSNSLINLIAPQCQTINFVSYIIFVIAFVGGILLIKGILFTK